MTTAPQEIHPTSPINTGIQARYLHGNTGVLGLCASVSHSLDSILRSIFYVLQGSVIHNASFHERFNRIMYPGLTILYLYSLSWSLTGSSYETWFRWLYSKHNFFKSISRNLVNRPTSIPLRVSNVLVCDVAQRQQLIPPTVSADFVVAFDFYSKANGCVAGRV